jgi:hypothetical protein
LLIPATGVTFTTNGTQPRVVVGAKPPAGVPACRWAGSQRFCACNDPTHNPLSHNRLSKYRRAETCREAPEKGRGQNHLFGKKDTGVNRFFSSTARNDSAQ